MTLPLSPHSNTRHTSTVHGIIQTARGMCSDELPHTQIDAMLSRAVDVAKDVEGNRDYWRSMYEDQLRRKRLLHDRYNEVIAQRNRLRIELGRTNGS